MVECCNCKNQDTEMCCCCIHGDADDHFEPMTKEDVIRAEEEAREALQAEKDNLYDYSIHVNLSSVFLNAYGKAIKCISQDRLPFMTVRLGTDHMFATNGFVACKIYTPIPPELVDKNVLRIDGKTVDVSEKIKNWPKISYGDEIFSYSHVEKNPAILRNNYVTENKTVLALFSPRDNLKIYIDQKYLDLVEDVLGSIDQVGYSEKYNGLVFEGKDGLATVMPVII